MRSRSYWYDQAASLIVHLTKDLPVDATLADRKKALWGKGHPAHQGTRWGRRKWGEAVRDYLARYGYRRPAPKAILPLLSPLEQAQKLHFTRGTGDVPPHPDSVRVHFNPPLETLAPRTADALVGLAGAAAEAISRRSTKP